MSFFPYITRRQRRKIVSNLDFFEGIGLVRECYDPERDDYILVMKYIGDIFTDGEGHFYIMRGNICIRRPDLEETYRRQIELLSKISMGESGSTIEWNGVKIGRWI